MKTRKFVDHAVVYASAGNGGNGSASFRREKYVPKGGPDGGDGGRGGHVIFRANANIDTLISLYFEPHRRAGHGGAGRGQKMHGKNGTDCIIDVPLGTVVRDRDTEDFIGELTEDGQELTVAQGGNGGLGNVHFKSSTHQAPQETTPGEDGQIITLDVELKMVADAGLVGFPNAGKSSLLTAISDAHPKIASYPFTTINPVPGTILFDDYTRIKVIDIPGIIHGAHNGVGLGDTFLRHIERAKLIVIVLDMAGSDGRSPADDYRDLLQELGQYNAELLERPRIVVANKMDVPEAKEHLDTFKKETKLTPIRISALAGTGLNQVKTKLQKLVQA
ncbi:MAG: GTPase ObgE [Kiritimatiellia bacterium]